MPNYKYQRSVRRERDLVNEGEAKGYLLSARTAGSKSKGKFKTDVIHISDPAEGFIRLIQVKTKKGGRNKVEKDLETYGPYFVQTRLTTWS